MPSRRSGAPAPHALSDRLNEVVGLLLVAFGVFLALALWTHHPGDPSWSRRVSAGWAVRNYGGTVGAYLAGTLAQVLGAFAALLPLGLVAWGVTAFAGLRSWRPGWRELGALVILLSADGMLHKAFQADPLFGPGALAGGAVGYGVAVLLGAYLGWAGSWVILLAALLAAVVATTGLSIGRIMAFVLRGSARAASRAVSLAGFAGAAEGAASAVRRAAWAAASPAASLPARLEGLRGSPDGAAREGAEEAGPLAGPRQAPGPMVLGPAVSGNGKPGGGHRRPARPGLLGEEEERDESPTLFGAGRTLPDASRFFLPGPAAADEEESPPPGLPAPEEREPEPRLRPAPERLEGREEPPLRSPAPAA
ncbi:MAG: DNA translocase FtsK 4TM domain-containing protein, partial [Nitrospinota bacterium]